MSLLTSINEATPGTYYFARAGGAGGGVSSLNGLDGPLSLVSGDGSVVITPGTSSINLAVTGGGGGSTAQQFTATGVGAVGGFISTGEQADVVLQNGTFITNVTTTGFTTDADILVAQTTAIAPAPNLARWKVKVVGSETGGNGGADFSINSYDDAGDVLAFPLTIERSTGKVGINAGGGLDVNTIASVGNNTTLAGGTLNINGSLGISRVFDGVYNTPIQTALTAQNSVTINTASGIHPLGASFLVPKSGIYIITIYLGIDVDAVNGATVGESDMVSVLFNPDTPGHLPAGAYLKPWSMPPSSASGSDYSVSTSFLAGFFAGDNVSPNYFVNNISATLSLPANSTIGYNIAVA
jgi:hypothetical protein